MEWFPNLTKVASFRQEEVRPFANLEHRCGGIAQEREPSSNANH